MSTGEEAIPLGVSRRCAELTDLDRQSLHVFVAGPGEGEAIAVALPTRGWLLLDGCRTGDGSVALVGILDAWRRSAEPIHAYVLTHPHLDHAKGIVELFERYGADIERIAVTPPWLDPDTTSPVTSKRLVGVRVKTALNRLRRAREAGTPCVDLVAGCRLLMAREHDIEVHVCCPTHQETRAPGSDHNGLSAVIEIVYGKSRIVLGSDLPDLVEGGTGGWESLLDARGVLGHHAVLKIPHHGSETARCERLFRPHSGDRAWSATPYNSSNLPDVVRMTGLSWILGRGQPVHLTAPPVSKKIQLPVEHPGQVRVGELRERIADEPTGVPLLDQGAVDVTPRALSAKDSLWCFAVDDAGRVVSRWRGDVALEVVA